ncbi:hypothetical protein GVAV_001319 [Gurleya vavrai]
MSYGFIIEKRINKFEGFDFAKELNLFRIRTNSPVCGLIMNLEGGLKNTGYILATDVDKNLAENNIFVRKHKFRKNPPKN